MMTTKEVMAKYYGTYGTGDYATVPFSKDAVFESVLGRFEGRENVVKHLIEGHAGGAVKEKLTPVRILIDGNRAAVEVDAELSFAQDIPDFPFGTAKKGESVVVKFAAFYETKNDEIAHVTVYRF
jgi:hypothetical protein